MNVNLDTFKDLGLSVFEEAKPQQQKQELGQTEFLKLMTTQLTHQNPLEPMESGDFLAQMAQFGTVQGIQDLQDSFSDFASSISSDQALQASNLVGRYVSAPSSEGLLSAGGEIKGQFELPSSSPNTQVKIIDSSTGDVVRNLNLGGHSKGTVPFTWDGLNEQGEFANPGVYKVQVEAALDGVNTILLPEIQSRVESVTMSNGRHGLLVNLAGIDSIDFNQIKQIL
jgi:flagellar basal-body rod modification protein FlgD